MGRLTDNDKKFLGITYGKIDWKHNSLTIESSNSDNENDRCSLTAYAFGYAFRVFLPNIIKPYKFKAKVRVNCWDEETIKRMGRDWYYVEFTNKYGISLSENGFLQIYYGLQNENNHYTHLNKDGYLSYNHNEEKVKRIESKSKSWFLPWHVTRMVSHKLYDNKHRVFWSQKEEKHNFDDFYKHKELCPTVDFLVKDYDGTIIKVKTYIEERQWKYGDGIFKWISLFKKDIHSRVLELEFEQELGKGKEDWKGGIMATSIEIPVGTTRAEALKKFCEKEHHSKQGKYKVEFDRLA